MFQFILFNKRSACYLFIVVVVVVIDIDIFYAADDASIIVIEVFDHYKHYMLTCFDFVHYIR